MSQSICRFPEINTIISACSSDIEREDADRLWGIGEFKEPDYLVSWVDRCQAGVMIYISPHESDEDDLTPRFSPHFIELYSMCRNAGVSYLMINRDARPVRELPLWGD